MKLQIKSELLVGVIAVLLGLAAGAILMELTGADSIEGYRFLMAAPTKSYGVVGLAQQAATSY